MLLSCKEWSNPLLIWYGFIKLISSIPQYILIHVYWVFNHTLPAKPTTIGNAVESVFDAVSNSIPPIECVSSYVDYHPIINLICFCCCCCCCCCWSIVNPIILRLSIKPHTVSQSNKPTVICNNSTFYLQFDVPSVECVPYVIEESLSHDIEYSTTHCQPNQPLLPTAFIFTIEFFFNFVWLQFYPLVWGVKI